MTANVTPAQLAEALRDAGGNKAKAAKALGMSPRTFGRRVDAHREEIEALIGSGADEGDSTDSTEAQAGTPDDVPAGPGHAGAEDAAAPDSPEPAAAEAGARPVRRAKATQNNGPAQSVKDSPEGFGEDVVTPVQFRHHLVREGLAAESVSTQAVYGWVRSKSFPARHITADGTVYEEARAGTRPGVVLAEGVAWFNAKFSAKA